MIVKELIERLQEFNPNLLVTKDATKMDGSVRIIDYVETIKAPVTVDTKPWNRDVKEVILIF